MCVDASVAAKWLLNEQDRAIALALRRSVRESGRTFVAPPHFVAEMTSAIYKRSQQRLIDLGEGRRLTRLIDALEVETMLPPDLPLRAFEIAAQFNLKWIYDAFYVALADMIGCDLWTADARLHEAVRGVHSNVRLLTNFVDAP